MFVAANLLWNISLFLFLVVWCSPAEVASGAEVSPTTFSFTGDNVSLIDQSGKVFPIFSSWNPKYTSSTKSVQAPGFHVSFFGAGVGCKSFVYNGVVTNAKTPIKNQVYTILGVSPDRNRDVVSWTPAADDFLCPDTFNKVSGPALVISGRQLELFTYAGDGREFGEKSFWVPYGASGQTGSGANAFIEGTFAAWIFDWQHNGGVFPWGGRKFGDDGGHVIFETTQSAKIKSGRWPSASEDHATQQFAVTFINRSCVNSKPQPRLCKVRYMVHTGLVFVSSQMTMFQQVNQGYLRLDSTQGSLPIFFGDVGVKGEFTYFGRKKIELWQSLGDQTQNGSFRNRRFEVEISFQEFLNGLRVISSRLMKVDLAAIKDTDVAQIAGPLWKDEAQWQISDLNIGQELRSQNRSLNSYIAGSISSLYVHSSQ